jgi:hypothetical protein
MWLTLISFPILIVTLWLTHAHLGWWMAAWLVASLVYLAIFSWVAGGEAKPEKKNNGRSSRSDTKGT